MGLLQLWVIVGLISAPPSGRRPPGGRIGRRRSDAPLRMEQDQLPGQGRGAVADKAALYRGHRPLHDLHAQGGAGGLVAADALRPLLRVPGGHRLGDGRGVGEAQAEQARRRMGEDGGDVVGDGVALRLPSWVMTLQT